MQGIFTFSQELRCEAIAYFEERFKEPVTHEQVDLYLRQLVELAIALEEAEESRRAPPPLAAGTAASPHFPLEAVPVPAPSPSPSSYT